MFIKKFFGAIILSAMLILSTPVHAEQSDWVSSNFDFRQIKSVIILDATINPELDYGGMIGLRGLQNTFLKYCAQTLNPTCKVISEEEARVILSTQISVNLERLYVEEPFQARQLVMKNAWRIADAYILGIVDSWGNRSYTAPTNVDYAKVIEQRNYYDGVGNVKPDTVLIPVPANYRPEGTDVPAIGMILRAYYSKNESIVFERYEMRLRKSNESQMDLFGSMAASFSAKFASLIR